MTMETNIYTLHSSSLSSTTVSKSEPGANQLVSSTLAPGSSTPAPGSSTPALGTMSSLHWADYVVFIIFLSVSLAIGIYHAFSGGKQRSTGEFIMADRRMSVIPTMLSLFVSYQSAILILGITAEVYRYGIQGCFLHIVAFFLATLLAERVYVPWIYRLKLTSVFEYLQLRYRSYAVRFLGVILGLCFMILYMGAALFAPATALKAVTGFPITATISIMAFVSTLYTAMGGMKAVVYTDVFQAVTMLCGILAILIKAILLAGGIGETFRVADEGGRLIWAQFDLDPRERNTFWGFTFGMTWTWSVVFGLTQPSVQRYCALPTLPKARQVVLSNIISLSVMNWLVGVAGLAIYAYYVTIRCDPLASGQVGSPNQIVPYFVVTSFTSSPGVSGLFMAALFSGAMSSVSSSLSSAAAVAWKDLIIIAKPDITDKQGALINKVLVVVFAVVAIGIAFLAAAMPSVPVTQTGFTFFSMMAGALAGTYLMGGCFKFTNWKGALSGCLAGVTFTLWLSIGAMSISSPSYPLLPAPVDQCYNHTTHNHTTTPATTTQIMPLHTDVNSTEHMEVPAQPAISGIEHFYTISYIWYALFGTIVTLLVGIPVSYLTGGDDVSELDDKLFLSFSSLFDSPCKPCDDADSLSFKEHLHKIYHSAKRKNTIDTKGSTPTSNKPPYTYNKCDSTGV